MRDRHHVACEIEIQIRVNHGVDCIRRYGHEQRIAVWRRLCDDFGADVARGARPVVNYELLAEPLRQPLSDEPRKDVGRGPGG